MAGIEDLKLWRTEPFLNTFQEFYDKPGLEWKKPYQSRWFSQEPYYDWLGPDTIMKELDTKLPFNYYDKAGQIEIPGEGFTMKSVKSAADLAKDRALLHDWFPFKGAGPFDKSKLTFDMKPEWYDWQTQYMDNLEKGLTKMEKASLDYRFTKQLPPPYYQKNMGTITDQLAGTYGKVRSDQPVIGRYTDNPLETYPRYLKLKEMFEKYKLPMTEWEKTALYKMSQGEKIPFNEITPPLDIANQAKVNLWESFKQNFMTPKESLLSRNVEKGIYTPKSRLENIMRIPHKAADIFQRYRAGQPIKSGIPWSTVGRSILNNPLTRFVGGAGNVLLGGQALVDVGTGSHHTKNMMTDVNRFFRAPMDRQGNVIQDTGVYENLQNVAQRDVLNPNEMRGVTSFDTTRYNPREMNTGGIASLV